MNNKTQSTSNIRIIKEGTTVELISKPAPKSTPKQPKGNE